MTRYLALLLLLAYPAAPLPSQVKTAKLAQVDVERIIAESTVGKDASARLQRMYQDYQEKATQMNEELEKLKKKKDDEKHIVTEQKRLQMEKEFEDKFVALDRFMKDSEASINEARGREIQQLNAKILPIIETIGKETRVEAVFQKSNPGVLYLSNPDGVLDLTDMVIKRLNGGR